MDQRAVRRRKVKNYRVNTESRSPLKYKSKKKTFHFDLQAAVDDVKALKTSMEFYYDECDTSEEVFFQLFP